GGSVSVGFLVAVLVSNIPEGLSATADLRTTRSPAWIYRLWGSIALMSGIAAALGYLVAHHLSTLDGRYVQALAAGAVLTMLSDSMMPEAFKEGGRPTALLTALGFAVAALLTTLDRRPPGWSAGLVAAEHRGGLGGHVGDDGGGRLYVAHQADALA